MPALIALLAATFAAVFASSKLAPAKDRNPVAWMWASALLPPSVLILAVLPKRGESAMGMTV